MILRCKICKTNWKEKSEFVKHHKEQHSYRPIIYQCASCELTFKKSHEVITHRQTHTFPNIFVEHQRALEGTARVFEFNSANLETSDLSKVIKAIENDLLRFLKVNLENGYHKVNIVVPTEYGRVDDDGNISKLQDRVFRARSFLGLVDNDHRVCLQDSLASISNQMGDLRADSFRWKVERILSIRFEFVRCRPLNGRCNLPVVSLTKHVRQTQIMKTKTPTNDCFYRAIATHFLKNGEDVESYMKKYIKKLHSEDRAVEVREIDKFELINPNLSLKINVLYMEGDDIYPIRTSNNQNGKNIVNIILYKSLLDDGNVADHYALVPNLEKFVRLYSFYPDGSRLVAKSYPCSNCFFKLSTARLLKNHMKNCLKNEPQKLQFPKENASISFQNFASENKSHFIGFFNLRICSRKSVTNCVECHTKNKCPHQNQDLKDQVGISYSLIILNKYEIMVQHHYIGDNCVEDLQNTLVQAQEKINKFIENLSHEALSEKEEKQFENATTCHICQKKLRDESTVNGADEPNNPHESDSFEDDPIVRDRCEVTGKFLGAAHNKCKQTKPRALVIPTFCNNFSDHVSHFILKNFKFNEHFTKIEGVGQNTEKISNLKLLDFLFLDSSALLPGSFDGLENDLFKSKACTSVLDQTSLAENDKKKALLVRGITFPQTFFDLIKSSNATNEFPGKEHFINDHSKSTIKDYFRTKKVFKEFGCCNLLDLLMLKMVRDIAVFADAFIHFREMMHEKFELDICQYLSFADFTYDCMLKMTKVEIEHIRDIDMYLMLSQNLRANFSMVSRRLETNETQSKTMEVDEERIKIGSKRNNLICLEANNVYGQAQSRMLPIGQYSFLKNKAIEKLDVKRLKENDKFGYILEVDLEYPPDLHEKHRSFPLAPDYETITPEMLSSYQRETGFFPQVECKGSTKLSATFHERKKYVIHYVTLKLYLSLGLKLVRIHRVIKFRQTKFMKPFVDYCTKLRQTSRTDFGKRLFKLMSNCIFENMLENRPKDLKLLFAQTKCDLMKHATHPRYLNFVIISPDLVGVYMKPSTVVAKAPYALGFTVSEYSKEFMYKTYYKHISKTFDHKCEVLMSDSESLFISTPFSLDPFVKILDVIDTSNFESKHPLLSLDNHYNVECFKSTTGSKQVKTLLALRSKCFAFETEGSGEENECQEEPVTVSKTIPMSNMQKYLQKLCLEITNKNPIEEPKETYPPIQMIKHGKLAFSSYDDKRYVLPCGIHTLPYGSREIESNAIECTFC